MNDSPYDPDRDRARLAKQREAIFGLMQDGHWRTLEEIESYFLARGIKYPTASISARLRDFRKPVYGSHVVDRQYVRRGLWRYRVIVGNRDLFGRVA